MVKGRSRKNPPYRAITDAKWDSLGETLTVKKALDLWWNSIRVRMPNGKDYHRFLIYKCYDGEYVLDDMAEALGISEEEVLKLNITLDEDYDEDSDGYPIAFAKLEKVKA